jgi:hypothetical protein
VNGISAGWGPQWRILRDAHGPTLDAWAAVHSARRAASGGAELALPLPGGVLAEARVERATLTADEWIRGSLANSIGTLLFGRDVRDYHEADRAVLSLRRPPTQPLIQGEIGFEPFLAVSTSRDRSIPTRSAWSLTGRDQLERPNPAVAELHIASAVGGAAVRWVGAASEMAARGSVERAIETWGDTGFTRWTADGRFHTAGLWDDQFRVRASFRGTLGDEPAPPQRWTHVGGPGTIPTLPIAALRGDHLAFVEAAYAVPLPFGELPFVGAPQLRVAFATGTAWTAGTPMPRWEQSLGGGFDLSILRLHAWVDPRIDRPRPLFLLELAIP